MMSQEPREIPFPILPLPVACTECGAATEPRKDQAAVCRYCRLHGSPNTKPEGLKK